LNGYVLCENRYLQRFFVDLLLPGLPAPFDEFFPPPLPADLVTDLPALFLRRAPEPPELFFDVLAFEGVPFAGLRLEALPFDAAFLLFFEALFELLLFETAFERLVFGEPFFEGFALAFSASMLSLPTASSVKESSAAYSSVNVCCSKPATLLKLSSLAYAAAVP